MSVSVYTAMMIQNHGDNIKCAAASDDKGKWLGQINFWKKGSLHTTLVDTTFNFDTKEEALAEMNKIVDYIRTVDLAEEAKKAEEQDKTEEESKRKEAEKAEQELERKVFEEGNPTGSDQDGENISG